MHMHTRKAKRYLVLPTACLLKEPYPRGGAQALVQGSFCHPVQVRLLPLAWQELLDNLMKEQTLAWRLQPMPQGLVLRRKSRKAEQLPMMLLQQVWMLRVMLLRRRVQQRVWMMPVSQQRQQACWQEPETAPQLLARQAWEKTSSCQHYFLLRVRRRQRQS